MTPSCERDENIFSIQPNKETISPRVSALLAQFGYRAEWLMRKTLSPEERVIVDARLLKLEMEIGNLESNHRAVIAQTLFGSDSSDITNSANDNIYSQAA